MIGLLTPHIPGEIICAAGMLPWHVIGTMKGSTPLAGVHRAPSTDACSTHILEAVLSGELDFLDGMIATNYDDDSKATEYIARYLRKPSFAHWLEVPIHASELALKHYTGNLARMRLAVEKEFDIRISDEKLGDAIREYNTARKLLHQPNFINIAFSSNGDSFLPNASSPSTRSLPASFSV